MELDHKASARSRKRRPEESAEAYNIVHRLATGRPADGVFMSIPVNVDRDADIIVTDAVHEIVERRDDSKRLAAALEAQGSDNGQGWHVINCQSPKKECLGRCVAARNALRQHGRLTE